MSEPEVVLKVIKGEDKGQRWALSLGTEYNVGRSRTNEVKLNDKTVSGQHARVECTGGVWFIEDSGSKHGTYVNRQRIEGKKALFDRDIIRLGKTLIEFRECQVLSPEDEGEMESGIDMVG